MFKKLILVGAFSLLSIVSAFAACTNPLAIKDATLATISMSMATGADGFCQYSFNMSQVGGTAVATGNGVTGAGSQRVTIASDNTAFGVNATLSAETTKVIGTVNQGTNPWVISGALTANQSVNVAQFGGVSTSTGQLAVNVAPVTATNTALVTALRPDSPGVIALGQTTKSASVPMAVASDQVGTAGTANATVFTVQGVASMTPVIANSTNGYPTGAIAETATATGTTAATTATLATAVSKTTYICGFSIRANATAAATANSTVTGTITGTLNFTQWTAPLASGIGLTEQRFSPCIPASTTNTSIAVVSAAPGSGGVVSVTAWGFQL